MAGRCRVWKMADFWSWSYGHVVVDDHYNRNQDCGEMHRWLIAKGSAVLSAIVRVLRGIPPQHNIIFTTDNPWLCSGMVRKRHCESGRIQGMRLDSCDGVQCPGPARGISAVTVDQEFDVTCLSNRMPRLTLHVSLIGLRGRLSQRMRQTVAKFACDEHLVDR
jgi:hypothetical protein